MHILSHSLSCWLSHWVINDRTGLRYAYASKTLYCQSKFLLAIKIKISTNFKYINSPPAKPRKTASRELPQHHCPFSLLFPYFWNTLFLNPISYVQKARPHLKIQYKHISKQCNSTKHVHISKLKKKHQYHDLKYYSLILTNIESDVHIKPKCQSYFSTIF